jgi:hypothetical protein
VHQTKWGGFEWLVIAGHHATRPERLSCVIGGGDQIVVAWDPTRPPDLAPANERDDFVPPPALDGFR